MFEKGQKIRIARRAIYASSHCSEREYEREVVDYREIEGQDAAMISVKAPSGKITRGRYSNGFINVYHPRAARYEVV
jgi:hypothetical protein